MLSLLGCLHYSMIILLGPSSGFSNFKETTGNFPRQHDDGGQGGQSAKAR